MLKLSISIMLKEMNEGQKPPYDEVVVALKAAAGFIERATEESTTGGAPLTFSPNSSAPKQGLAPYNNANESTVKL